MPSVLVVDDNIANRMLASRLLKRSGWDVAEAADGQEALDYLGSATVDLILLDISMPGLSGEEVCEQVRRDLGRGPKIVAYTAHAMPEEQQRFIDHGFDAVLIKPISRDQLNATLAGVGFPPPPAAPAA
jgi:CheY-like chemotaxis protein